MDAANGDEKDDGAAFLPFCSNFPVFYSFLPNQPFGYGVIGYDRNARPTALNKSFKRRPCNTIYFLSQKRDSARPRLSRFGIVGEQLKTS